MEKNVGSNDKVVRIVVGAVAGVLSLAVLGGQVGLPTVASPVFETSKSVLKLLPADTTSVDCTRCLASTPALSTPGASSRATLTVFRAVLTRTDGSLRSLFVSVEARATRMRGTGFEPADPYGTAS